MAFRTLMARIGNPLQYLSSAGASLSRISRSDA